MAIGNSHHPPPHSAFHVEKPTSDSVSNIRIDDGASLGTLAGGQMPISLAFEGDALRSARPTGYVPIYVSIRRFQPGRQS